MAELALLTDW